ncbi:helix-turn-helix domain-containing protein [Salinarimonas ramus]|uniref:Transcriptional regulator n=1 Tax=Salinarimonas ramus TaxID=690164 RepID=A0A917QAV0_9HYPH|nr:helix-turn-helix transcriptional regulator [Salinarimonas ramus]GGK40146.1 transcriptional regulator [Salinarimonas ramus]
MQRVCDAEETAVEPGSDNVLADLGFDNPEEELLKARIVDHLRSLVEELGLTQSAAGERLGLRQPDVSRLLRGRTGGYTIERLLRFVRLMGEDVTITVSRKPGEVRDPGRLDLAIG